MESKQIELSDRIEYRNDQGELHREDGPARVWSDGGKSWFINGLLHRENGPAIEYTNGYKEWYKNGKLHREDGPACGYSDGNKEWFINGKRYSEERWKEEVLKLKLNRIKNL